MKAIIEKMDLEKLVEQNINGDFTVENLDVITWLGVDILNDHINLYISCGPQLKEKLDNK